MHSSKLICHYTHPSFFAPNGNCLGQMSPKLSQTAAISWSKRITINLPNSQEIQDFHKLNTTLSHSDMGRRSHLATYFLKEAKPSPVSIFLSFCPSLIPFYKGGNICRSLDKTRTIPNIHLWKIHLECHTLPSRAYSRASLPLILSFWCFFHQTHPFLLIHPPLTLLRCCVVYCQAQRESMTGAHAYR